MFSSQSPKENGRPYVETVTLTDETGRALLCSVEHTFEIDGQEYLLLLPVDTPVEIFTWVGNEDDQEPVPLEDGQIDDELFSTAKAVLAEQNLILKRTAITLTVEGELPEVSDEEFEDDDDVPEGDYEELQWLASFYHKEQEFAVYTPLDPLFILARINAMGKPELLSPEEIKYLEPILPTIEGIIQDRLFEDME
ncbi:MAG: DUF3727 domain-containing protein [Oscillatoriaceae bacterium SKW80]|nr:DUF3727 domain-containing protein [Oscillatoriaceae bacterium SKYG93]MCX8122439.1 DUF3727 domain-containing protein [Oscillatoriaceae bacterium SKW80]MDW8452636.1 DUF3727 domain-containing protein [Oscillatoriaceae cyanobacterium SKYGB_i_bin93]HIK28038.1 DUF3727 domain-containing protein [Oscillatoriaceae cyanobacterium M7585_C2015_266]